MDSWESLRDTVELYSCHSLILGNKSDCIYLDRKLFISFFSCDLYRRLIWVVSHSFLPSSVYIDMYTTYSINEKYSFILFLFFLHGIRALGIFWVSLCSLHCCVCLENYLFFFWHLRFCFFSSSSLFFCSFSDHNVLRNHKYLCPI